MAAVIVDTGPLVAYLDGNEQHHAWVRAQLQALDEPMLACDAVLVEASFVLGRRGHPLDKVFGLLQGEVISLAFDTAKHWRALRGLAHSYRNLPMSLADACLVRMSELHRDSVVFTLDRDFLVYRRNGRQKIPLLAPFA